MRPEPANGDRLAAQIAARHHGVVTSTQLRDCGLNSNAISRRLNSGRLHRMHRGVYAVGHSALSNHGRWLAAVLACGPTAALSHRSATELLTLLPGRPGPVHVTVTTRAGRDQRPSLVIHRTVELPPSFVFEGIRVTTAARALADLRRVATDAEVRQAIRAAQALGYMTGLPELKTRSELEDATLALFRRHLIPPPLVNEPVGSYVADFLWPVERLVVEVDGYAFHSGRAAFGSDRERQNALVALGFEVLRFTFEQVDGRPRHVATTVRCALRRRARADRAPA